MPHGRNSGSRGASDTDVPHVDSINSLDDRIVSSGEAPTDRIWLVLEDGRPEAGRWYFTAEEDAKDDAWNRNWARWEYSESSEESTEMTFAEYRASKVSGRYDYAPADLGPVQG